MPTDTKTLAQQFRYYAETVFGNSSPLYAHLSAAAADDPELMRVLAPYGGRRVFPVLLMAAVQETLMANPAHPLAHYVRSLTPTPLPPVGAFPAMRDLFFAERERIEHLLETRIVQTNEVRRCAALLPTFARIYAATKRPLALLEIGSSMGFMLNWTRYRYDYGDGRIIERAADTPAATPTLTLDTATRGRRLPLPTTMPPVQSVVGLDINPLSVADDDDVRWLRALIWPEHQARRERLDAAIALARHHPPTIHAGDARELLPGLLDALHNTDATPVLLHSHALVQLPKADRQALFAPLAAWSKAAGKRPLFRVQLEWYRGMQYSEVWRYRYVGGRRRGNKEAETEAHGAWLAWWARR